MSRKTYVDCEIDIDDVLSECTGQELIDALNKRGGTLRASFTELKGWVARIKECLKFGTDRNAADLLAEVLNEIDPDGRAIVEQRYALAMQSRDPKTKRPVVQ